MIGLRTTRLEKYFGHFRKSLKAKYDEVVNAGDKPSREIPSAMVVSLDLFKTTCCCQDSELPKSFEEKKKKKKKS